MAQILRQLKDLTQLALFFCILSVSTNTHKDSHSCIKQKSMTVDKPATAIIGKVSPHMLLAAALLLSTVMSDPPGLVLGGHST